MVIEIDKSTVQKPSFELEPRHLQNSINIVVIKPVSVGTVSYIGIDPNRISHLSRGFASVFSIIVVWEVRFDNEVLQLTRRIGWSHVG